MKVCMLTTVDNPYDPFTDFKLWYAFDTAHGYNSAAFLARIVVTSDELTDTDYHLSVELAIDEIVEENVLGLWKKVSMNLEVPTNSSETATV